MSRPTIPIEKLREVLQSGKDVAQRRNATIRIAIFVDRAAPGDLVETIKSAFMPELPTALVHAEALGPSAPAVNGSTDVAVVVAGGSDESVEACVRALAARSVPCAVVAESSLDAPDLDGTSSAGSPVALIAASSREALLDKLANWLIDSTEKDLALSASFPFIRHPKAMRIVQRCAGENAAVGAIGFIPGADMPVMTANQAKMALEIAAVYGQDVTPERIPELLGVVGGGFACRTAARQVVGLVPGIGWALKGGVGYAGTIAMGNALVARFELGGEDLPAGASDAARRAAAGISDLGAKAGGLAADVARRAPAAASKVARGAQETAREGARKATDAISYVTIRPRRKS
ncbi:MAG: DUF697 domain-containing protein [Atopobiaceae bacterium]|jgi:uncharacterized protein (DUF697 family)|nr:DUF697 domain-containing protein [Atopobiaceae bacterium]